MRFVEKDKMTAVGLSEEYADTLLAGASRGGRSDRTQAIAAIAGLVTAYENRVLAKYAVYAAWASAFTAVISLVVTLLGKGAA